MDIMPKMEHCDACGEEMFSTQQTCDECGWVDPNWEPSDDAIYNGHGMEGGIPYDTSDMRTENDV